MGGGPKGVSMSKWGCAALLLVGAAFAASFAINGAGNVGRWSGDAIVHLSLAERAARGDWFELNAGEPVAAETSMAWLAMEAMLMRAGGVALAIAVVPWIEVLSVVATGALVYQLARRSGACARIAGLGALAAVSLPGVAMNAALGMENMLFAAAALAFLSCVTANTRLASAPICGATLAFAMLLRPEAVALVPVLALHNGLGGYVGRVRRSRSPAAWSSPPSFFSMRARTRGFRHQAFPA